MYHKITDYYFGQFSCLYKEVHTYDKEPEEFCLKNKSVIAFMMNMAEEEYLEQVEADMAEEEFLEQAEVDIMVETPWKK